MSFAAFIAFSTLIKRVSLCICHTTDLTCRLKDFWRHLWHVGFNVIRPSSAT
jgi:hypothetical protein